MAAGEEYAVIIENPTALSVSAALATMIAATNTTARFCVTALGMGKGVLLSAVSQA